MEAIFEFIFANLFFVILVLGALFNLFMRNKSQEEAKKEQEKKRRAQGSGNAPQTQEIDWKEIFRQEQSPAQTRPERPVAVETMPQQFERIEQTAQTEIEKQRALLQKKQEELLKRREGIEESSPIFNGEIRDTASGKSYFHNLTKDEVVKGVVWSEVLGKPRSKKPLDRFYSKKIGMT